MSIVISRVDDRMVHGQVTTSWVRSHDINVIIIVDDEIAKDSVQTNVLKLSAPVGIKLYVVSSDKFIDKFRQGIFEKYHVMLIFENVFQAKKIIEQGIDIKLLNIGGIRFRDGRKQITKAISLSEEEVECVKAIYALGTRVEHRQVQADSSQNVMEMIERG